MVPGPAIKSLQELRPALPRLPSEALLPPEREGSCPQEARWGSLGVTGLETGGFTRDPHCQQNVA